MFGCLRRVTMSSAFALIIVFVAPTKSRPQVRAGIIADVDRAVERGMQLWRVPGLAIGVVVGDSVRIERGYGVLSREQNTTVNENTLFEIGSLSKAFSAALIATLVREGRVGWGDPVDRHLPEFRLLDRSSGSEITVSDLLAHNAGIKRLDLSWFSGSVRAANVVGRLRWVGQEQPLRSGFSYSNLLYMVSGRLAERVTGSSWEELISQRILMPLDMTRSLTRPPSPTELNVARPHIVIDGVVTPTTTASMFAPEAGGMYSTVNDMLRWLPTMWASGVSFTELGDIQTIVPFGGMWQRQFPRSTFLAYGRGWFVANFGAETMLHHVGGFGGMVAAAFVIPKRQIAIIVLTNHGANLLPLAIGYSILDRLMLPGDDVDWNEHFGRVWREIEGYQATLRPDTTKRITGSKPSRGGASLAATYQDDLYGTLEVQYDGKELKMDYGQLKARLDHWHFDTYKVSWLDPFVHAVLGETLATFRLDANGVMTELELEGFPGEKVKVRRR